jgi:hypothetical protein
MAQNATSKSKYFNLNACRLPHRFRDCEVHPRIEAQQPYFSVAVSPAAEVSLSPRSGLGGAKDASSNYKRATFN